MRTDPLTFEVLRHRIVASADEASAVLSMVSSSPVAAEANDCNVAVMDAHGAAITIGPGLGGHGISCMMTTRYVLSEYQENPGVRDGDMFLANDPYRCTSHQTCIALVSPVFWDDTIVAWVGAGIHLPDAGGPVPGQVSVGAGSIYQEATPMPPLRIVEQGRIRKDIEAEFVVRSRTQQQLALDFRALIAACQRLIARLREILSQHGPEVLAATFDDIVSFNQAHIARRLSEIPVGTWEASVWLDYPEDGEHTKYFECRLVLNRRADGLVVDLRQSSEQAAAVINCGEPGLISAVVNSLMALLGYGLPLCPEAILRSVEIQSRPGTFVHAQHPAGCSKATTAACHAIVQALNMTVSRMLCDVPSLAERAIAGTGGFLPVIELEGADVHGKRFAAPLLDIALSAGYGAMTGKDGIDSGGQLGSPLSSIANVETYEARYPILYLWRRHEPDSGGLGTFRGGRGVSIAFTPHRTAAPLGCIPHGHGCSVVSTPGLAGGYPGATNTFEVARGTQVIDRLASGTVPQSEEELSGSLAVTKGFQQTRLAELDVIIARNNGGGGFGDPLKRDPEAVMADVRDGAVSVEWAARGYGVVVDGQRLEYDDDATRQLRTKLVARRRETAAPPASDALTGPAAQRRCRYCGAEAAVSTNRRELSEIGARVLPVPSDEGFIAREQLCSRCGSLLDVQIVSPSSPG